MGQSANRTFRIWQKLNRCGLVALKWSVKTNHNRIVTLGLLVAVCYLPGWLGLLWKLTLKGDSDPLLNIGFLYLGLQELWKHRQQLANCTVSEEDRLLGYLLIISGAVIFPFCLTSVSLQAVFCMVILLGIGLCSWGIIFLKKYSTATILLMAATYPNLLFLGNTLRTTFTNHQLENFMAWSSSLVLQAFGQAAIAQGSILSLSPEIRANTAVEVASGCSGFDMAFTLAGMGLILGLFFKQTWTKTISLVVAGALLALILNIPRIMLLAFAVVYWGKGSFEFWHGPIGGQLFSSVLLTVYYYMAIAFFKNQPAKS